MAKAKPQSSQSPSMPVNIAHSGLRQQIAWAAKNDPAIIPSLLAKGKTYQNASAYTQHRWENTAKKIPAAQ